MKTAHTLAMALCRNALTSDHLPAVTAADKPMLSPPPAPDSAEVDLDIVIADCREGADERAAIAQYDGGVTADQAEKMGREWMMDCLARWFLDPRHAYERRASWGRMKKRHGEAWAEEMKARIKKQRGGP